jgi:hypothetical protein
MTQAIARTLARRSSRRQFFKFMGASSLGVGLFLGKADVALGSLSGCVGCGGGPCNPCFSPVGRCDTVTGGAYLCKSCAVGGGCPPGCQTSGEWFCCTPATQCRLRCSECNCPAGCQNPSCHCFTVVPMPCRPTRHSGDQPCGCPPLEKQPLTVAA